MNTELEDAKNKLRDAVVAYVCAAFKACGGCAEIAALMLAKEMGAISENLTEADFAGLEEAAPRHLIRVLPLPKARRPMADIQWPSATYWNKAWNPIIGCKPCSPACDNCYARCATVERFGQSFEPHRTKKLVPPSNGVVFCGNMTDIFGDWNSYSYATELVCRCLPNKDTTYLWCTKRPDRMVEVVRALCPTMTNHYFGFTAENQEWHDRRAAIIPLKFPTWANKWMSCEPLLGPVDLKFSGLVFDGRPAYDWVAVGCESGPHRRPCKLEWVESIVDQCLTAGVPVFVKQLDINGKCERDITKFPKRLQYRQVPWIQTRRTP